MVKDFHKEIEEIILRTDPFKLTKNQLTNKESEILDLFLDGLSQKEIGERYGLHPSTVSRHKRSILRKTNFSSINQLLSNKIRSKG